MNWAFEHYIHFLDKTNQKLKHEEKFSYKATAFVKHKIDNFDN